MKNSDVLLRAAAPEDAAVILAIYRPYVERTAVSFECTVPTEEEIQSRIQKTLEFYPYLVAEDAGHILGFTYAGPFSRREAYAWSVETTIYLRSDARGLGVGKRLYSALEDVCKSQNFLNLNACIASPEAEDQRLTKNSVRFHSHIGYQMVGEFHKCGYKFGTWYNMVWMEKFIGEHSEIPLPVIPFPALDRDTLKKLGIHPSHPAH